MRTRTEALPEKLRELMPVTFTRYNTQRGNLSVNCQTAAHYPKRFLREPQHEVLDINDCTQSLEAITYRTAIRNELRAARHKVGNSDADRDPKDSYR